MLVTVTGEWRVGEYGGGETPRKCADVCTGGERGRCGERWRCCGGEWQGGERGCLPLYCVVAVGSARVARTAFPGVRISVPLFCARAGVVACERVVFCGDGVRVARLVAVSSLCCAAVLARAVAAVAAARLRAVLSVASASFAEPVLLLDRRHNPALESADAPARRAESICMLRMRCTNEGRRSAIGGATGLLVRMLINRV